MIFLHMRFYAAVSSPLRLHKSLVQAVEFLILLNGACTQGHFVYKKLNHLFSLIQYR